MEDSGELRFGVIGAGWFASRRHIPDIRNHPDAVLGSICRRDEAALARLKEHFEPGAVYTDWQRMLEDGSLDAIVIATPPALHYKQARAALERGLHVLVEKPMTVHADQARELCELAHRRGLKLAVALNPPYWAHCHRMRAAIQHGRIGEVEAVSMFWTGNAEYVFGRAPRPADLPGIIPPTLFRADPELGGGGYLMDGGPHLVSEVLWVTGLRAKKVACVMDTVPSDRRASLALTLENGAIATITSVGNSQSGSRRVRNAFAGSHGTITVEGFDFATSIQVGKEEAETFREGELPPVPGPVANLIDAIHCHAALFSPCDHGLHVTEVIDAAYRSAEEGRTIEID